MMISRRKKERCHAIYLKTESQSKAAERHAEEQGRSHSVVSAGRERSGAASSCRRSRQMFADTIG